MPYIHINSGPIKPSLYIYYITVSTPPLGDIYISQDKARPPGFAKEEAGSTVFYFILIGQ